MHGRRSRAGRRSRRRRDRAPHRPESPQLAPCAAAGCTRWFLRSHAARRWCTTKCGNRVRAARSCAARKTR
ncbi:CGNR zinc finger domain-containing protein [Streptomyces sp. NPDC058255]|uniref:CGNR zinc finger domain-containing protein n=1 Tax=Streptomyces sp. NPDC058255 TaxID=3346407 RepID=UPI0036E566B8